MKILVFDDSELHRKAAEVLLKGHDLTIVSTYDEAEKALRGNNMEFDVVMTDLLIKVTDNDFQIAISPARRMEFDGVEMPLGTTIALLALGAGVKKVAVVTDASHHAHPASAALDAFYETVKVVGDARMLCMNGNVLYRANKDTLEPMDKSVLDSVLEGIPFGPKRVALRNKFEEENTVLTKNWAAVLEKLLS